MDALYLWLKAAHVIFVIFWMAGLFMLPRMMVYQQEAELGSAEDALYTKRIAALRRVLVLGMVAPVRLSAAADPAPP